ncbi:MAG: carboxypeptidase regulatory-like domain-containing protein [Elusimicrobia bacterium]|nr:carboxypeptidase regulatory-like domain-containing protein [Elusimicrobiota bacterium]
MSNQFKTHRVLAGITLVELMIAVIILVVAALGVMGVFIYIAKSIQHSKCRGLASNLSQEQLQVLKQKNYYRVMVTTTTAFQNQFVPAIPYDTGYFPPETILEGGITFTRYTNVEWGMEVSGQIQALPATSSDTNLKVITVTTVWNLDSGFHKVQIRNVLSNPDAVMASSLLKGTVDTGGVGIPDALITVSENTGALDTTDVLGKYMITLFPGNYNLTCEAQGYFTKTAAVSVATNTSATVDFTLVAKTSATLSGYVWRNDHLVISQVVGSSVSASGFDQEYVEIYNPTTWTWTVPNVLGLTFQRKLAQDPAPINIAINYAGSPLSIVPGGFYLFANTSPVVVAGMTVAADAVWESAVGGPNEINFAPRFITTAGMENYNIIPVSNDAIASAAGGVRLYDVLSGTVLDTVGWSGDGAVSPGVPSYETAPIFQNVGLQRAELFARYSSTAGLDGAIGPAYDSNKNSVEWREGAIGAPPRSTLSAVQSTLAGTPAIGAVVSCNDGLSGGTTAVSVGNPPLAQFSLPNVATGTWTVFLASSSLYMEISTVTVNASGTLWIPNAATSPAWPLANHFDVFLSSVAEEGYISGTVKNALNAAITPAIIVSNGSRTTTASTTSGFYMLKTQPGSYMVWANANNANVNYVSDSTGPVVVTVGQVSSNVNFTLSQSGKIRGFVSRDGVNALPGVAITATNASGFVESGQVSDASGRFTMANVSTGTFVIEPVLNSGESVSPVSANVVVGVGALVWSATFTVRGAMGNVHGTAQSAGVPVRTGVMIIATTTTIVGVPPTLNQASLLGAAYYTASTNEDGTYSLDVRGSTTTPFRVYAYYPVPNGPAWTLNSALVNNVWITPGVSTAVANFNW